MKVHEPWYVLGKNFNILSSHCLLLFPYRIQSIIEGQFMWLIFINTSKYLRRDWRNVFFWPKVLSQVCLLETDSSQYGYNLSTAFIGAYSEKSYQTFWLSIFQWPTKQHSCWSEWMNKPACIGSQQKSFMVHLTTGTLKRLNLFELRFDWRDNSAIVS